MGGVLPEEGTERGWEGDIPGEVRLSDSSEVKRPASAFLLFAQEKRGVMREGNPSKTNIQISQLLSDQWKNMSEEDKKPFRDKAAQRAIEFRIAHPNYVYRKARRKKILNRFTSAILENPLLEAQLVSGQFASDVYQYPLDPYHFFLFAIGNRYISRVLHGEAGLPST
jgi:hypothetical protein